MDSFACGHPLTDENSYFLPRRRCKLCHRRRTAEYRRRNRLYYRVWNRLYYRGVQPCSDMLTRAWR